jgi:hypothetical protein
LFFLPHSKKQTQRRIINRGEDEKRRGKKKDKRKIGKRGKTGKKREKRLTQKRKGAKFIGLHFAGEIFCLNIPCRNGLELGLLGNSELCLL